MDPDYCCTGYCVTIKAETFAAHLYTELNCSMGVFCITRNTDIKEDTTVSLETVVTQCSSPV